MCFYYDDIYREYIYREYYCKLTCFPYGETFLGHDPQEAKNTHMIAFNLLRFVTVQRIKIGTGFLTGKFCRLNILIPECHCVVVLALVCEGFVVSIVVLCVTIVPWVKCLAARDDHYPPEKSETSMYAFSFSKGTIYTIEEAEVALSLFSNQVTVHVTTGVLDLFGVLPKKKK